MFEQFKDKLVCDYSTRNGGVSTGCYDSMNLSLTTDDALANILENYKLWCGSLGIDTRQLVMLHQTHSSEVIRVDEENCGEGQTLRVSRYLRRMRTVRQSISMIPLTRL